TSPRPAHLAGKSQRRRGRRTLPGRYSNARLSSRRNPGRGLWELDPGVPREPEMNEAAARAEIFSLLREMEAEPIHVHHVAALALQLFDQLAPLHGLDARARL